jgi:hypothetical protein
LFSVTSNACANNPNAGTSSAPSFAFLLGSPPPSSGFGGAAPTVVPKTFGFVFDVNTPTPSGMKKSNKKKLPLPFASAVAGASPTIAPLGAAGGKNAPTGTIYASGAPGMYNGTSFAESSIYTKEMSDTHSFMVLLSFRLQRVVRSAPLPQKQVVFLLVAYLFSVLQVS